MGLKILQGETFSFFGQDEEKNFKVNTIDSKSMKKKAMMKALTVLNKLGEIKKWVKFYSSLVEVWGYTC